MAIVPRALALPGKSRVRLRDAPIVSSSRMVRRGRARLYTNVVTTEHGMGTFVGVEYFNKQRRDIDPILRALLTAFPGSEITAEDSFEAERAWVRELIEVREREGRPFNNPAVLLGSIDSKEMYLGRAKNILMQIGEDCSLIGRITSLNIALRSRSTLPNPGIEAVAAFLESLDLGPVKVRAMRKFISSRRES